jgi:phospholipase/carboxylesterase
MSHAALKYLEVGSPNADKCVIWLHGLGADGHDFKPIVAELKLPADHNIRFIFPHAPQRPVSINAGMVMPAWFDLYSMNFADHEDEEGIRQSAQQLNQLIEQQKQRGINSNKIVLAGFSQGGAIVLHTALRYPEPLAGVMALSTYLPLIQDLQEELSEANRDIPIIMCHGTDDPVVPYQLGDNSQTLMKQAGLNIDWHSYPMQHSVCPEEINDIGLWLQKILL